MWAWRWGAIVLVLLAAFGTGYVKGSHAEQLERVTERAERLEADATARGVRDKSNTIIASKQAATNDKINTEAKNEISRITSELGAVKRLRRPSFCDAVQPVAGPAKTETPNGSPAEDTRSGVLPESVDRRIRQLIAETEAATTAGRACQKFAKENGFMP